MRELARFREGYAQSRNIPRNRVFKDDALVELASTNVPKARARELYIDHTPPPTPEEIELRRMQRLSAPPKRPRGAGSPKKRERRELRRLKEGLD